MEIEWKKKTKKQVEANGNGMEMEIVISSVWNWCKNEWIVQCNFVERGMKNEWR